MAIRTHQLVALISQSLDFLVARGLLCLKFRLQFFALFLLLLLLALYPRQKVVPASASSSAEQEGFGPQTAADCAPRVLFLYRRDQALESQ